MILNDYRELLYGQGVVFFQIFGNIANILQQQRDDYSCEDDKMEEGPASIIAPVETHGYQEHLGANDVMPQQDIVVEVRVLCNDWLGF